MAVVLDRLEGAAQEFESRGLVFRPLLTIRDLGVEAVASGQYYPGTEEAHTNPTRQRGECLSALAGASG